MKRLNAAVDRFALRHPNFGIPNLMRYIVIGNVLVYLLYMFTRYDYGAISFLAFDLSHLLHGEVWRLVTFVFMPFTYRAFTLIIMLSFYYFVGNMLEREWGTAKFTLYYLSGMILSVLSTVIASLVTGNFYLSLSSAHYINLTLFLAFAVLYPDARIMFYFIIPLKAKWLAIADAVLFAWGFLQSLVFGDILGCLMPVIAILNFVAFFWEDFIDFLGISRRKAAHQNAHQTIQFKAAVRQQKKREAERGYRHKCEICGRTDMDFPDLEFRYCSRCAGYHCYCQDHIFNHEHHA